MNSIPTGRKVLMFHAYTESRERVNAILQGKVTGWVNRFNEIRLNEVR